MVIPGWIKRINIYAVGGEEVGWSEWQSIGSILITGWDITL